MKENKKLLQILSVLLVIIICLSGCGKKNNEEEPNNSSNAVNPTNNSNLLYVGAYEVNVKTQADEGICRLILREDNTFVYGCHIVAFSPLVGTYSVNDSTIALKGIIYYGSDACYYTKGEDIKTMTATILDENTLSITTDSTGLLKYTRDGSFVESVESKNRYVINPINGKLPNPDDEDGWVNCDGDLN